MEAKSIFNLILMALSLTTIFITLVSYIIFKLRQARIVNVSGEFHRLEGVYFRRYAPKLELINEEKRQIIILKEKNPKKFYLKIVSVFIYVFIIIMTVFLAEDYYYHRAVKNNPVEVTIE